jgi:hypothetical protein
LTLEVVAKLLCPEKSMILMSIASGQLAGRFVKFAAKPMP